MATNFVLLRNQLSFNNANRLTKKLLKCVEKDREKALDLLKLCEERLAGANETEEFVSLMNASCQTLKQAQDAAEKWIKALGLIQRFGAKKVEEGKELESAENLFGKLGELVKADQNEEKPEDDS